MLGINRLLTLAYVISHGCLPRFPCPKGAFPSGGQGNLSAFGPAVNGRDGQLVRAEEMWFLQAPLPDGSVFNLQAPLVLTRDQVIAIGEQVTVRR